MSSKSISGNSQIRKQTMTMVPAILLFLLLACMAPGHSSDQPGNRNPYQSSRFLAEVHESDITRTDDSNIEYRNHPLRRFLPKHNPELRDYEQAPGIAFRKWAGEPKPLIPSLLFILFVSLLGNAIIPARVQRASRYCREQFWSCLGRAILAGILLAAFIRILLVLEITIPLVLLLSGLLQMAIVAGLCVGTTMIGRSLAGRAKLEKIEQLRSRPRLLLFIELLAGSTILALIGMIPGVGELPRIGIRIVLLVAILGAGGLLKTKSSGKASQMDYSSR